MSLINDALKRAKEAQPKTPPVNAPQLKPVDLARHSAQRGIGLMLPIVLALIALGGLLFVWQLRQKKFQAARPAETQTAPAIASPQAAPAVAPVSPIAVEPPAAPIIAASKPVESPRLVIQTSAAPVIATAPPQPPPLKLQAIFFNPTRPSAIISGKTVGVGETIGEFRVRAIDQEQVTLASATRTNILSLVR